MLSYEWKSLILLTLLNSFVAEHQSDAPDDDEEYDVQSDDESVCIFSNYYSLDYLHQTLRFYSIPLSPLLVLCVISLPET